MLQPTTTAIGGSNLYSTAANPVLTANAGGSGITGLGGMQAIPQTTQVANAGIGGLNAPVTQGGLSVGRAAANDVAQVAAKPGLMDRISTGYSNLTDMEKLGVGIGGTALLSSAMAPGVNMPEEDEYKGPLSKFKYDPNKFNPSRITPNVYQPRYAQGGIAALAGGGYPMGRQDNTQFATPTQMPMSAEVLRADYEPMDMARGGIAGYSLGGYAAGGNPRLLKGPGDGMSDDIPATIANKQPARLADGEFVVPADVVSHLGNGSTDAGAKHLYKMMDKVRKARTGKKAQGKQIKSERFLPA
jgi:hypothetical protein